MGEAGYSNFGAGRRESWLGLAASLARARIAVAPRLVATMAWRLSRARVARGRRVVVGLRAAGRVLRLPGPGDQPPGA